MLKHLLEQVNDELSHLFWKYGEEILTIIFCLALMALFSWATSSSPSRDMQTEYRQMQIEDGYNL